MEREKERERERGGGEEREERQTRLCERNIKRKYTLSHNLEIHQTNGVLPSAS